MEVVRGSCLSVGGVRCRRNGWQHTWAAFKPQWWRSARLSISWPAESLEHHNGCKLPVSNGSFVYSMSHDGYGDAIWLPTASISPIWPRPWSPIVWDVSESNCACFQAINCCASASLLNHVLPS